MTRTTDDIDRDERGAVRRRALVEGAAWTIPVIAAAAAAPLAAASGEIPVPCPAVPASGWSVTVESGQIINADVPGIFVHQWVGDRWYNSSDANTVQTTRVRTVSPSFPTIAGKTYTFTFTSDVQFGSPNFGLSQMGWFGAGVNGQFLLDRTTRAYPNGIGTTGAPIRSAFSFTWTAATTGPASFFYVLDLYPRFAGLPVNDDTNFSVPTITCV